MKKVKLIAELCQNHFGDLSIVEEMIHVQKKMVLIMSKFNL